MAEKNQAELQKKTLEGAGKNQQVAIQILQRQKKTGSQGSERTEENAEQQNQVVTQTLTVTQNEMGLP